MPTSGPGSPAEFHVRGLQKVRPTTEKFELPAEAPPDTRVAG